MNFIIKHQCLASYYQLTDKIIPSQQHNFTRDSIDSIDTITYPQLFSPVRIRAH